jgi:hypothetical protein
MQRRQHEEEEEKGKRVWKQGCGGAGVACGAFRSRVLCVRVFGRPLRTLLPRWVSVAASSISFLAVSLAGSFCVCDLKECASSLNLNVIADRTGKARFLRRN